MKNRLEWNKENTQSTINKIKGHAQPIEIGNMNLNFKTFAKYFMIGMPVVFFIAGTHCLYEAIQIFKLHEQQK